MLSRSRLNIWTALEITTDPLSIDVAKDPSASYITSSGL